MCLENSKGYRNICLKRKSSRGKRTLRSFCSKVSELYGHQVHSFLVWPESLSVKPRYHLCLFKFNFCGQPLKFRRIPCKVIRIYSSWKNLSAHVRPGLIFAEANNRKIQGSAACSREGRKVQRTPFLWPQFPHLQLLPILRVGVIRQVLSQCHHCFHYSRTKRKNASSHPCLFQERKKETKRYMLPKKDRLL